MVGRKYRIDLKNRKKEKLRNKLKKSIVVMIRCNASEKSERETCNRSSLYQSEFVSESMNGFC